MFTSHSHHIVMRRRRPGNGFRCVWAYKNPTLHDFWVRANLGVYGRVTGQGVSRARACHGPGRVTGQGVSRTRACHGLGFGPGLALVCSRFLFWCFDCLLQLFTTSYYLLLPFTTFYHFLLPFIAFDYILPFLPFTTFLLPFTAFYNF